MGLGFQAFCLLQVCDCNTSQRIAVWTINTRVGSGPNSSRVLCLSFSLSLSLLPALSLPLAPSPPPSRSLSLRLPPSLPLPPPTLNPAPQDPKPYNRAGRSGFFCPVDQKADVTLRAGDEVTDWLRCVDAAVRAPSFGFWGLRFWVQGSGIRVQGLGFR